VTVQELKQALSLKEWIEAKQEEICLAYVTTRTEDYRDRDRD